MFFKKILVILMLSLLALPLAAQDDAEVSEADTTVGPLTFTLPEDWSAIPNQDGRVIIASIELEAFAGASNLPDDVVITQVQLIGKQRITGLGDNPSAEDILTAMTSAASQETDEEMAEVITTEGTAYEFAQIDISSAETSANAIVFNLTDETIALATVTTLNAETTALADNLDTILGLFDTFTLTIETPFLDSDNVYADIPQSVSEEGFAQLGDPDAPVELVEIGSFDCPACAQFHAQILPELLPRIEAGELLLTYVSIYGTGGIPNGDSAARAAICAIDSDVYWQWHSALYEWQSLGSFAFMYERLQQGAAELGIEADAFDECFIGEATTETLVSAFSQAEALGDNFPGTPALLINGAVVPNSLELLNIAIDAALEQAETD